MVLIRINAATDDGEDTDSYFHSFWLKNDCFCTLSDSINTDWIRNPVLVFSFHLTEKTTVFACYRNRLRRIGSATLCWYSETFGDGRNPCSYNLTQISLNNCSIITIMEHRIRADYTPACPATRYPVTHITYCLLGKTDYQTVLSSNAISAQIPTRKKNYILIENLNSGFKVEACIIYT